MTYNFDKIVNRKNTSSMKWDREDIVDKNLLPMWVADMDFKSPPELLEDFQKIIDHGIFGYFNLEEDVYEAIVNWVLKRHGWEIKKEWIVLTPGVVLGLNLVAETFLKENDQGVIQPPIYPPFFRFLENHKVEVLENPLIKIDGKYRMDLRKLEGIITDKTRAFVLCNPHNPTGRVWEEDELRDLIEIIKKNKLMLISDDIHADLVYKGHKYIPIASLDQDLAQNSITFIAPTKTFNIAGLSSSIAIIPNENLRSTYLKKMEDLHIAKTNIFGKIAIESLYTKGEAWLEDLLIYLESNINFALNYFKEKIPEVRAYKPDGTYLMWLDFSEVNRPSNEINDLLIKEGRILLNEGLDYGKEGEEFFRLNVACPRAILEDGLKRIEKAIKKIR